jgi:ATP-binding cassette subfamily C protein LapB
MSLSRQIKDLTNSLAPARLVRVLRGPALILFFAGVITNIVTILTSLFTLLVYDKVYPHDGVSTLIALTIGTLALMSIDAGLRIVRSNLINHALFGAHTEPTVDSFRQRFRVSSDDKVNRKSYLEKAIQDLTEVQPSDVRTATLMVELPFILVLLIAIFMISGPLMIVPMVAIIAMLIVTVLTLQKNKTASAKVDQDKRSAIQSLAHASRGADWFFGMGAWRWMQLLDSKLSKQLKQSSARLASITNTRQIATQAISQLISIATVFFGFFLFREGTISMGAVIATYILSTRCLSPLASLAQITSSESPDDETQDTNENIHEAKLLLKLPAQTNDWVLALNELTFTYPGKTKPAISIKNLQIKAGQKIAVIGRSGSGKSTFGKLLVRAIDHHGGAIRCMGLPMSQIDPEDWERFCIYIPQVPWFGAGSAFDQIRLGMDDITDVELGQTIAALGLSDLFTGRASVTVGDGLSTGQIQLLGLMRCLVRKAPLIILDEPTNSLDIEAETRVMDAIFERYKDATILLITHKKSLLSRMDRALVFENGELAKDVPVNKNLGAQV